MAAQEGHAGVAALPPASPGVHPSQANKNGATPLHVAAQQGHAGTLCEGAGVWGGGAYPLP